MSARRGFPPSAKEGKKNGIKSQITISNSPSTDPYRGLKADGRSNVQKSGQTRVVTGTSCARQLVPELLTVPAWSLAVSLVNLKNG
jgi:hypothetical protein